MTPLLGGSYDNALRFLQFGTLNREPEKIAGAVQEIAQICAGVKDTEALRRWMYLANYLNSHDWEFQHTKRAANAAKLNLDMM